MREEARAVRECAPKLSGGWEGLVAPQGAHTKAGCSRDGDVRVLLAWCLYLPMKREVGAAASVSTRQLRGQGLGNGLWAPSTHLGVLRAWEGAAGPGEGREGTTEALSSQWVSLFVTPSLRLSLSSQTVIYLHSHSHPFSVPHPAGHPGPSLCPQPWPLLGTPLGVWHRAA